MKRLGVGVDNGEESRGQSEKVPGNLEARETSGKNIQGEGTAGTKAPPQYSPNLGSPMPTGKDSTRGLRRQCIWSPVPCSFKLLCGCDHDQHPLLFKGLNS